MRYAAIEKNEIINGEGVGITLWVQGCPHHCIGCYNPETWDFKGGNLLTRVQESQIYKALNNNYISRFSVSGGEPLVWNNLEQLNHILCTVKSNWPNKKIWIWTGYTWDELQKIRTKHNPDLLFITFKYTDYLITGPFIQEEKDLTLLWRGSRNQEIIDIIETHRQGKKVLWRE